MSGLICDVCIGGAQILLGGYVIFAGLEYIQSSFKREKRNEFYRTHFVDSVVLRGDPECCVKNLKEESEIEMPELKSVSEKKNEEKSNNNNNNSRAAEKEKEE